MPKLITDTITHFALAYAALFAFVILAPMAYTCGFIAQATKNILNR